MQFLCGVLGVMLLSQPFASHFCNIFNTDNGERERERVRRWGDDET